MTHLHTRRTCAALIASIALVSGSMSPGSPSQAAAFTASNAPTAPAQVVKFVQLGDSYSAGNGATGYYGAAGCYRSHNGWGSQYSAYLRDAGYAVDFTTVACSGGVLDDILNPNVMETGWFYYLTPLARDAAATAIAKAKAGGLCGVKKSDDEQIDYTASAVVNRVGAKVSCTRTVRPQIDSVTSETDLVALTMGGNDLKFLDLIAWCFVPVARSAGRCRAQVNKAYDEFTTIQSKLVTTLTEIRARMSPTGQIVLVSYPYMATTDSYVLNDFVLPQFIIDSFDAGTATRTLGDAYDGVQAAAIDAVNATAAAGANPVAFIDTVKSAFAGHEPHPAFLKVNRDRWVHEFDSLVYMEWYHPNLTGHTQEATLLRRLPVPAHGPGIVTSGDVVALPDPSGGEPAPPVDPPVAVLDGPFDVATDEELTLDARGSYAMSGALVSYDWDLDGDGEWDQSTAEPTLSTAWPEAFEGTVSVQVTDDSGASAIGSTTVSVSRDADGIPDGADNCPAAYNPGQEDADGDGQGDGCDTTPTPPSAPVDPGTWVGVNTEVPPADAFAASTAPTGTVAVKTAQPRVRLVKGTTTRIPALALGADGTKAALTWGSSTKKVATVSATGTITAKRAGKATITVQSGDRKATIAVTVVAKAPRGAKARVTSVQATGIPAVLAAGTTAFAAGSYVPASPVGVKVTYTSSNPAVLGVDKAGRLTALAPGVATVTVKAGKESATYPVTVM
ncbi:MAG: Ig-like domain-containing protein [Bifidobacteriaceae bacterium]|jgi:uncharacterized protein YjdB/lysophospholipase L1-like esterase|nr:Ig-like domain-containing protein [Bifidobacteriaceae bacterium]